MTTIFCDSHEIGNVMDVAGVEAMLEDARQAPLSIFLTVPSHRARDLAGPRNGGRRPDGGEDRGPVRPWPEAVALGEKMDFVQVAQGDERSHAILAAALRRGRPSAAMSTAANSSPPTRPRASPDTHEAIDCEIADDMLEAGIWLFLRGGPADDAVAQPAAGDQGDHGA